MHFFSIKLKDINEHAPWVLILPGCTYAKNMFQVKNPWIQTVPHQFPTFNIHAGQDVTTLCYRNLTVLKLSDGHFLTTHSNLTTSPQKSQSLYART